MPLFRRNIFQYVHLFSTYCFSYKIYQLRWTLL